MRCHPAACLDRVYPCRRFSLSLKPLSRPRVLSLFPKFLSVFKAFSFSLEPKVPGAALPLPRFIHRDRQRHSSLVSTNVIHAIYGR